ncbi:MAG: hypothetical protein JHC95_20490 [Solirubrobacteraceae bacterium]|nr:hypothetical protein [Solirubrobacteraceae bacterium]
MSFHVLPVGRDAKIGTEVQQPTRLPVQPSAPSPEGETFAKVYDYSVFEAARSARKAREAQIPSHVMDEVQAAARLYEDLQARDRHVRFDTHRLDGRVVADLCDTDGNVVRPISLREIVESNDPDTAA